MRADLISAPLPAERGEADGRRPAGEGSSAAIKSGPLTLSLSRWRGRGQTVAGGAGGAAGNIPTNCKAFGGGKCCDPAIAAHLPKAAPMMANSTGLWMPGKGYFVSVNASTKVCSKAEVTKLAPSIK